jgi:hypothetical protein
MRCLSVAPFSVPHRLMSMTAHMQMTIGPVVIANDRQSQMKRPYPQCKSRDRRRSDGRKGQCRSGKIGGQFSHGPSTHKELRLH